MPDESLFSFVSFFTESLAILYHIGQETGDHGQTSVVSRCIERVVGRVSETVGAERIIA